MLASLFHTIVAVISGFTTAFWFMVFIGAMALLILMPPPEPKPKAEPAPAPKPDEGGKADNEAKWRKMLAFNEAKWRRMLYMMHMQRAPVSPQPPVQINIMTPDGLLAAKQAQMSLPGQTPNQTIDGENSGGENNAIKTNPTPPKQKQKPRLGLKRFAIPRPKLSIPRPRVAAKSTTDELY